MSQAQEVYSHDFDAVFLRLGVPIRERIEAKICEAGARLETHPHHRLKGMDCFRLRAGDYRIIYQFDVSRNIIYLITLGHRREIYKGLR